MKLNASCAQSRTTVNSFFVKLAHHTCPIDLTLLERELHLNDCLDLQENILCAKKIASGCNDNSESLL
jgi:hypothetical protein